MEAMDCTQVIHQEFSDSEEESGQPQRKSVAYLKLLSGHQLSENTYSLFVGKNYIGRGETCDISINSQTLSKQHAVIEADRKGKHFEVYDLGSSNKTRKGKIVLKPNVRYSLEQDTSLFFADVEFLFQIGCNEEIDDVSSETGSESMFVTNSISSQSSPEKHLLLSPCNVPESPNRRASFNTLNDSSASLPDKRPLFCSPFSDDGNRSKSEMQRSVEETPAAALLQSRLPVISNSQSSVSDEQLLSQSTSEIFPLKSKYSRSSGGSQPKITEELNENCETRKETAKPVKFDPNSSLFEADTQPYEDMPPTQLYSSQAQCVAESKNPSKSLLPETQLYVDDDDDDDEDEDKAGQRKDEEQKVTKESDTKLEMATQLYVPSDDDDNDDNHDNSKNSDDKLPETQLYVSHSSPEGDKHATEDENQFVNKDIANTSTNHELNGVADVSLEGKQGSTGKDEEKQDNESKVVAGADRKSVAEEKSKHKASDKEERTSRWPSRGKRSLLSRKQVQRDSSSADSLKNDEKLSHNVVPVVVCVDVASPKVRKEAHSSDADTTRASQHLENLCATHKGSLRTRKRGAATVTEDSEKTSSSCELEKNANSQRKRERKTAVAHATKSENLVEATSCGTTVHRGRRKTNNSQISDVKSDRAERKSSPVTENNEKRPSKIGSKLEAASNDAETSKIRKTKQSDLSAEVNKNEQEEHKTKRTRHSLIVDTESNARMERKTRRSTKHTGSSIDSTEDETPAAKEAISNASPCTPRTRRWNKQADLTTEVVNLEDLKSCKSTSEELRVDPLVLVMKKSSAGSSPYTIQRGRSRQVNDELKSGETNTEAKNSTDKIELSSTKVVKEKGHTSKKRKKAKGGEDANASAFSVDENENLTVSFDGTTDEPTEKDKKNKQAERLSSKHLKANEAKRLRSTSSSRQKGLLDEDDVPLSVNNIDEEKPSGVLQSGRRRLANITSTKDREENKTSGRTRRERNRAKPLMPVIDASSEDALPGNKGSLDLERTTRSRRGRKRKTDETDAQNSSDISPTDDKEKTSSLSLRNFRKKNTKSDTSSDTLDISLNESRTSISPSRMFDSTAEEEEDIQLQESSSRRSRSRSRQKQKRESVSTSTPSKAKSPKKKLKTKTPSKAEDVSATIEEEDEPPRKTPKNQAKGKKAKENDSTLKTPVKANTTKDAANLNVSCSSENATPKSKRGRPKKIQTPKTELTEQDLTSPDKFNYYLTVDEPCISFTGITEELQQAEKIIRELGGRITDNILESTHLVTDKVRRTCKFLCQVARGRPIVTLDWLHRCKKDKKFSSASQYVVSDSAAEKQYGFNLQKSLVKASNKSLLQDYSIHVTPGVKPEPAQMKSIIECAGGQYLSRMPASNVADRRTIVVSCTEDLRNCSRALAGSVPVVSAEFILTGILKQSDDIESYCLIT